MKISLKTGMKSEKNKIEPGLEAKISQNSAVKMDFMLKLRQFSPKTLVKGVS